MSANSQQRSSGGASEVQNRVYGPPLKQLIRPQEYSGTGTGAKDVRKSVRFHTLSSSSIQIGFTGEGVCCFTLWTLLRSPQPRNPPASTRRRASRPRRSAPGSFAYYVATGRADPYLDRDIAEAFR